MLLKGFKVVIGQRSRPPSMTMVMSLNITLMTHLGLWRSQTGPEWLRTLRVYLPWVGVFFLSIMLTGSFLYIVENAHQLLKTGESAFLVVSELSALIKCVRILLKNDQFRALLEVLNQGLITPRVGNLPGHQRDLIVDTERKTRRFTKIWSGVSLPLWVAYISVPLLSSSMPLPYNSWLPWDATRSPMYELTYLMQSAGFLFYFVVTLVLDSFFISLAVHICCQFSNLQDSLRNIGAYNQDPSASKRDNANINKSTDDTHEYGRRVLERGHKFGSLTEEFSKESERHLIDCVRHHQEILSLVNDIENFYNPLIFIHTLATLSVLILSSFQMIQTPLRSLEFAKLVQSLLACACEFLLYCWFSDEMANQGILVSEAAYDSHWYSAPTSFKNSIRLIMTRASKPASITIGKLRGLTNETFQAVISVSYSNFALLRQIYESRTD